MGFEFDGEQYKKASKHQKEWGTEIINQIAGNSVRDSLREDGWILDLGCGDGVLTEALTALVPKGKVIGIDASIGMIETAKRFENDRLSFRYQDINNIQFDEVFDLIFSNAVLHWVQDHHSLLEKCYKALKINGRVRFNFAGDGNCAAFFNVVREVIKETRFRVYFIDFEWPWYNPSSTEYQKLIEQLQLFSEIKIKQENKDRYFISKEEMIGWLDQPCLVPFLKILPDQLKKDFRDEIIERMIKLTSQSDGTFFETFRRIDVSLKK